MMYLDLLSKVKQLILILFKPMTEEQKFLLDNKIDDYDITKR